MGDYEFVVGQGSREVTRTVLFPSRSFLVGSGRGCELRFDGAGLRETHAEVLLDEHGQPWVRDLTGQGLVWVNSVMTAQSMIPAGTQLKLGELELVVRRAGPTPQALGETREAPRPRADALGDGGPLEGGVIEAGAVIEGGSVIEGGTVIEGRYRVVRKMAAGGMGEVYQAVHIQLGKPMAIKVMRPELSRDPQFVARFKREAIAASRVGQLNIVDVSDFGQTRDGRFFFVMEYLDGETLASLLRRCGAMAAERALVVAAQVGRALVAAHAQGIVHRDLKPENIMLLQLLGQPDFVKVLDFGVAKVAKGSEEHLAGQTAVGVVMGTPKYMSPEQARGLAVDARTDIYALGLILYELVTGRPAFTGATASALMVKQATERPPPLMPGPVAQVPPALEALIFQMLEKNPAARPQAMTEVVSRLAALEGKLRAGSSEGEGELVELSSTEGSGSSRVAWEDAEAREPASRASRPLLWLGLATLALSVGGATAYLAPSPSPELETEAEGPQSAAPAPARLTLPPLPTPTAPSASRVTRRVSSTPSGAAVYQGETWLGATPLEVSGEVGEQLVLRLVLARHQETTRTVAFETGDDLFVELKPVSTAGRPKRVVVPDDVGVIIDEPRAR